MLSGPVADGKTPSMKVVWNPLRWTTVQAIGLLIVLSILVVGVQWLVAAQRLRTLSRSWEAELTAIRQSHAAALAAEEEAERQHSSRRETLHQTRLKDPEFLNGSLGHRAREAEWLRRIAFDPALARTPFETNLLQMARLGKSTEVSAREALERVALLAAPDGSRVEVNRMGELFEVKVAFRMSALSRTESGPVTKHLTPESMRREVEDLSVRVLREIVDSCSTRSISRIQVTCNHEFWASVIPPGATPEEMKMLQSRSPVVMGRLYRVSLDQAAARSIVDWRRVPAAQVVRLMKVEYDGFPTLTINRGGREVFQQADPNTPLQF
jgi:hypothetical protein